MSDVPYPLFPLFVERRIDADGKTRSKTRTLPKSRIERAKDESQIASILPSWTFDGSSTGQAPGADSEVYIKPVRTYPDPFRPGNGNLLVLCETYTPEGQPLPTNTRNAAAKVFADPENIAAVPWFGLEQGEERSLVGCYPEGYLKDS
jgi:glutamine synthetase